MVYIFTVTSSAARLRGEACGVERPRQAAAVESSACGRGKTVSLTLILDRGQFLQCAANDLERPLRTVHICVVR